MTVSRNAVEEYGTVEYLRIVRKYLRLIILVTVMVSIASYVYGRSRTPVYMTRARLEIEKVRFDPRTGVERAYVTSTERGTLIEVAGSMEVAERVADSLASEGWTERLGMDRTELASAVTSWYDVSSVERSNIIEISASTFDPDLARDVANAAARVISSRYIETTRENQENLGAVLDEQISIYYERVLALEDELSRYRNEDKIRSARGVVPDISEIGRIEEQNSRLRGRIEEISGTRRLIEAAGSGAASGEDLDEAVRIFSDDEGVGEASAALEEKREELRDLLSRYTEAHPGVEPLRSEISTREAALSEAISRASVERLDALDAESAEAMAAVAGNERRIREIRSALAEQPERNLEEAHLERELSTATSMYQNLRQRREELSMMDETEPPDRIKIVSEASRPSAPIYPNIRLITMTGAGIGGLLGIALAFFLESMDTAMSTISDVERLMGKPVLAVIPSIRIPADKIEEARGEYDIEELDRLPVLVDPRAPSSEAYRTLRTVLSYSFFSEEGKALLITSATPQEGKTTTLANLAFAFASMGKKTIVVGGNLRHPVLSRFFEIDGAQGLSDVLTGKIPLREAIMPSKRRNLWVLDAGTPARRPAELLTSQGLRRVISALKSKFEIILLDSPPILPVTDAVVMAPVVDGVLLVYSVGVPPREAIVRAAATVSSVKGEIIGVVLNDINAKAVGDYAHYYYYHRYPGLAGKTETP